MTCLFMPIFLGSSITKFVKKVSTKFEYSVGILVEALSHCKLAKVGLFDPEILEILERWVGIVVGMFRMATYITKDSKFLSRAALAKSFLSMSLIWLIVG